MNKKLPPAAIEKSIKFPFAYYKYDSNDENFVVQFHYHEEEQIFRCQEGSACISINAVTHILKKGDCVLLAGDMVHAIYPLEKGTLFDALKFNVRELFDLSQPHYSIIKQLITHQIEIKPIINKETHPELVGLIDTLFDTIQVNKDTSVLFATAKILEMLGTAIEQKDTVIHDQESATRSYKYYQKSTIIYKYICDNFKRDMTLDEMANAVDFSEKYFCKFFKELTDLRPMEFLNMFRIEAATTELANSTDSINEVAARCGFKDPCYFTKLFRRFKGASPRDFREKIPNMYYK